MNNIELYLSLRLDRPNSYLGLTSVCIESLNYLYSMYIFVKFKY